MYILKSDNEILKLFIKSFYGTRYFKISIYKLLFEHTTIKLFW